MWAVQDEMPPGCVCVGGGGGDADLVDIRGTIKPQALKWWVYYGFIDRIIHASVLHLIEVNSALRGLGDEGCPGHNYVHTQLIVVQHHILHSGVWNCMEGVV